ncbi:hypothetical protein WICMUC_004828 [Wickerhamomyces mucosus]|uniref:Major facilitator superfamily (MFS) profile domain-containing protein n=1 Tax=Wickerhamomyces mucosus TaxID=1378264 RepID=A0A9P8PGI0_9ASCO|nr:hypothetical protein WICMUC_004828 [Wickerhamomyces mucosus]
MEDAVSAKAHLEKLGDRTSIDESTKIIDLSDLTIDDPIYKEIEKRVIRKFDFIIIPCLSLVYLFSNLDKSNIGNAEAAGMAEDLGLINNQYGNAVSLLFVTYTIFETPVALCLKYIGAKTCLSLLVLCFGITSLCTSFVHNYKSLVAVRVLLGFFESGIIPIINVYLGMLYTRAEMAKRCSAVYSASAAAGGFGGLLAYGLIKIDARGWEGWRWLFTIEGALTICSVPIIACLLPNELTSVWWLSEDEKKVLKIRLTTHPDFFQDEKFSWSEVKRSFLDVNNILICCYEFCADLTLVGISTFLPSIIKGMGYNRYTTQLLTVPFYAISLISFIVVSYFSDKLKHRGGFLIGGLLFEIIGYAILIGTDSLGARYFGCMLIGVGMYVCSALCIIWINNNNAGHYKRATIGGMITTIGSCAGVLAGQIYTVESAPRYFKGLKIALSLTCTAIPFILAMMYIYHKRNVTRDTLIEEKRKNGEIMNLDEKPKDDRDINYRFIL